MQSNDAEEMMRTLRERLLRDLGANHGKFMATHKNTPALVDGQIIRMISSSDRFASKLLFSWYLWRASPSPVHLPLLQHRKSECCP